MKESRRLKTNHQYTEMKSTPNKITAKMMNILHKMKIHIKMRNKMMFLKNHWKNSQNEIYEEHLQEQYNES